MSRDGPSSASSTCARTLVSPDARSTAPAMVDVAGRYPRLNLLNLEAVAVARLLVRDDLALRAGGGGDSAAGAPRRRNCLENGPNRLSHSFRRRRSTGSGRRPARSLCVPQPVNGLSLQRHPCATSARASASAVGCYRAPRPPGNAGSRAALGDRTRAP